MFLNFKILFAALLLSTVSLAQQSDKDTEAVSVTKQKQPKSGSATVGLYMPIAFGDNFVNNGINLKIGMQTQMKLNLFEDFYVGPALSFFSGKVNNQALIGNYDEMTNIVIGGMVGYEKQMERFDLSIGLGVGYSNYNNRSRDLDDNFKDDGTALWLRPEVSYRLMNYLSVYLAPELRHDFMNIETVPELDDTFKGVNYFNIGFGLRFNFGTGYKFQ